MTDNNEKVIPNVDSKSKEERNVPDLRTYRLKDLVTFGLGLTYTPEYKNDGIVFISSKNLSNDYLDLNNINYISLEEYNSISINAKPQKGDILFTRVGSNLGHPTVYDGNIPIAIFVSVGYLRVKKNAANNEYIKYWMQSRSFWRQVDSQIAGSSKMNLNIGWMSNFKLTVPSLTKQDKIAFILQRIDNRIITQKKIINNLESLINTIKNKIFNNEVCISKTPLKDILIEINRKSTVNNQFPVISSTVKGLVLQSEYFDKEIASENNIGYKIISKDNIILSPQNLWMGNITYNDKFGNGIVSPSYKIFNISEKYNGKYIFEMLTTKKAFYYYKTVSEQGASVVRRNLNYEAFMELMFNVPPKETQDHDIKILESYNDKLTNEKKILLAYEKQKQYLLNHMFI